MKDIERRLSLLMAGPDEKTAKTIPQEPAENLPLFGVLK